ncbi:MAG: cytochrome c-type biogenesis CcmF C-terminal domain-containing protein [Kofleriaceae bacterium]
MTSEPPFSPVALVGTIALLAAYALGAWCVAAGVAGNARKHRGLVSSSVYGLYGFGALVSLASAMLIYGFVTHDFSIKYVASNSDVAMSTQSKVTAFWGGLDGSLLLWVLVLALFSVVAIAINVRRHRDMIGYVVATIMVVQVFFLSLLIFTKNPFATMLGTPPPDGKCLNPLLQNYWMVIHPPSLYIGFVAATIPFAFGVGALASGRLDDLWLGSVRVWMLICFLFLSLGLILGGRWAYEELGWGGYWAWDPVENAGFIPWFTATAFLHSAIIQEQRGMMKRWNMSLVILTFFLTMLGTFMTRSGIVQSVHAFGEDNVLAMQFVIFMVGLLVVAIGLLVYRWEQLASRSDFESFFSREFAFLLNNWILLACAAFIWYFTMHPTFTDAFAQARATVGIPFFNGWMGPAGVLLLLLAGVAPLLAWRKTTRERLVRQFLFPCAFSALTIGALLILRPHVTALSNIFPRSPENQGIPAPMSLICFATCAFAFGSIVQEFWRGTAVRMRQSGSDPFTALLGLVVSKRRKYGGYVVHLGIAVMFIGFAGKVYDRMLDRTIERPALADSMPLNGDGTVAKLPAKSAAAFQFADYTFLYEQLITTSDDQKNAVSAQVSIWQDGERLGVVYPAKWKYKCEEEATTEVAIKVRFSEDIYVVLTGYDTQTQMANFRVFVNPLISWVWVGFLILAFGTLICLIPQRLVDMMSAGPTKGRVGRAGDSGLVLLLAGALVAGVTGQAHAQPAEHEDESIRTGGGMTTSPGAAAMNRPQPNTVAERAMKELLCMCGCTRESIFDCKCDAAADFRGRVLAFLGQTDPTGKLVFDMQSADGKAAAYDAVLTNFVKLAGGEQVLATPRSSSTWLIPTLAVIGGLVLMFTSARRWIGRSNAAIAATPVATIQPEDTAAADKLDDELAETD